MFSIIYTGNNLKMFQNLSAWEQLQKRIEVDDEIRGRINLKIFRNSHSICFPKHYNDVKKQFCLLLCIVVKRDLFKGKHKSISKPCA
jgi:hypothetical protein